MRKRLTSKTVAYARSGRTPASGTSQVWWAPSRELLQAARELVVAPMKSRFTCRVGDVRAGAIGQHGTFLHRAYCRNLGVGAAAEYLGKNVGSPQYKSRYEVTVNGNTIARG